MLYVDGSSTNKSASGRIVLVTLEGTELKYAVRLKFAATNNEVNYEALLTGLWLARVLGAR